MPKIQHRDLKRDHDSPDDFFPFSRDLQDGIAPRLKHPTLTNSTAGTMRFRMVDITCGLSVWSRSSTRPSWKLAYPCRVHPVYRPWHSPLSFLTSCITDSWICFSKYWRSRILGFVWISSRVGNLLDSPRQNSPWGRGLQSVLSFVWSWRVIWSPFLLLLPN